MIALLLSLLMSHADASLLPFQQSIPNTASNYSFTATVAANALTISLKDAQGNTPTARSPVKFYFKNTTAGTTTPTVVNVTASNTLVISSGSTLGTVNGATETVHIYAVYTGSGVELCAATTLGNSTDNVVTSVAEGGAGAADNRSTLYCTSANSSKPFMQIGRIVVSEATAGTWATAPSSAGAVLYPVIPSANVTSVNAAAMRVEHARASCSSSASITSQSGNWISTASNISSNRCSVTIAQGIFTTTPTCIATAENTSTNTVVSINISPTSATNFAIGAVSQAGAANTSFAYDVTCTQGVP